MLNLYYKSFDSVRIYKNTFANYKTALGTPDRTVTPDNYTYQNGNIRISYGSINDVKVSYILDDVTQKCYFVTDYDVRLGFIIYYVRLDVWGTYSYAMTFDDVEVTRSNVVDANAIQFYPDISFPFDKPRHTALESKTYAVTDFALVAVVSYELATDWFGFSKVNQVSMLVHEFTAGENVRQMVRNASHITNIESTSLKANIMKCYIVKKTIAHAVGSNNTASFPPHYSYNNDGTTGTISFAYEILNGYYEETLPFSAESYARYVVGTKTDGVEVPTAYGTNNSFVSYRYVFNPSNIQVLAICGTNSNDISSSFEVTVTAAQTDTNIEKTAKALQVLGSGVALASGLITGNPIATAGGVLGMAGTVNKIAGQHAHGSLVGAGNGITTIMENNGTYTTPYYATYFDYAYDESAIIKNQGLIYEKTYDHLSTILALSCYGDETTYFIQARNVKLSGGSESARNEIKQLFAQGIFITK